MAFAIEQRLANELGALPQQVAVAIKLLDEGASVPFIARYRKEVTGGLNDSQLRQLQERLIYLRELEQRRQTIIAAITTQQKMTPDLLALLKQAQEKTQLEDLYLSYRPKRRTKAKLAFEAGLAHLAERLLTNPTLIPEVEAQSYLRPSFTTAEGDNPGVPDAKAALEGARQILIERFSENAILLAEIRNYLKNHGVLESKMVDGAESKDQTLRFADYYDYHEPINSAATHRILAILRGRREGILTIRIRLDSEIESFSWSDSYNPCERRIASLMGINNQARPADKWLMDSVRWAWRVRIYPHLETELLANLREQAENEAIAVFAKNLRSLLLAAPAGAKVTMGLDPGIRTGVKVAVIDTIGRVLAVDTIYPHQPRHDWQGALNKLSALVEKYHVELIAIGNGTASRETDQLVQELIQQHKKRNMISVVVSEAGASVYSASSYAATEFPDMDVSLRSAVSIARRLQDPLAELVKIDPKSIGVGQYQHDVLQTRLSHALDAVVEDCVNAVGVDVNTASIPLLTRVSGLSAGIATNIVSYRNEHGSFVNRESLKAVPRFGEKTFEQAAGFLRISQGDNPLDASAVHPESYGIVRAMLRDLQVGIQDILGNQALLMRICPEHYANSQFGLPTVKDIINELKKPGRDPRPVFTYAKFQEGIKTLNDLKSGMILEGAVTNVTAFGAFVDIGVHQDGLVHISELSDHFVSDPYQVVKTGQIVTVTVLNIDLKRRRIALSMKSNRDLMQKVVKKEASSHQTVRKKGLNRLIKNTAISMAFSRLNKE